MKKLKSLRIPSIRSLFLAGAVLSIGVFTLAAVLTRPADPKSKFLKKEKGEGGKKKDGPAERLEQEIRMTKDPALGYVPTERLLAAKEYKDALMRDNIAPISGVNWKEQGPNNVGGRTRAIMVDPNDGTGNTVWAGSVGGGLWKTTNMNSATPNWAPVNDLFGNLAVTSIAYDPSNTQVMYFATGEGYFNLDAIQGFGVWKTTNGGTSWVQLASTTGAAFNFCHKVVVNSTGIVFVATGTGGVQRSANGGSTFTKVLGTGLGITGAASNRSYDVEVASNGDVYGSLDGSIHKSTNAGVTFAAAQTLPIAGSRIEIACAPNDSNYVYALVENGSAVNGILRTVDGGTTWTSRTEPADADPGVGTTDFSRGQAWYDLAIAVDPNNRNRLYVGGIDLFVSGDGAGTWTQVAHWYGGFGFQYVHADQHNIVFQNGSSSIAYFVNDGGVYRTTNAETAAPTIDARSGNYRTAQFYAAAMHPTALTTYYLAGAQDNGTQQFNTSGPQATVEVTGGDGAFTHIDQDEPQFQFTQYVYNDYYRSNDGGASWTNFSTGGGQFINPTDYDDVNDKLYASNGNNNYLRWDNPQTGGTFVTVAVAAFNSYVSAVKVSPNTANVVFFGTGAGRVVRVDSANTGAPTSTNISTGLPAGGYVSSVEVETGNDNHLLVTYSNYGVNSIWESTNGGTSWTSVEGNLPDMPIRWVLFNPNNSDQAIIATELGVWSTDNLNGGSTVWGASNSGLANVRVDMLQVRQSDKYVIAATHGRGLYASDLFTSPTALFNSNNRVTYVGQPVYFNSSSYQATSWSWDFGDGSALNTLENPGHLYQTAGKFTVTLTINGGASSVTKTQYIHVLPNRGTPYAPSDGGGFETNPDDFGVNTVAGTAWQRGNSAVAGKNGTNGGSSAWVTGLVGNYVDNSDSSLLTPNYNFTAAGTYTLRFSTKFATETGFDGFRVEYTLDKGATWTTLGTAVAANWYNNANNSGSTSFPANEAFFSGSQAVYALKTRDVSFLAGNASVAFRFKFRSDVTVPAAGVAVDDFDIVGPVNAPMAPTAAGASISGRVTTADGRGIVNAAITITGNSLQQPKRVKTSSFGYYFIDGLQAGETYVVTINSKRYTFSVPSRVISLNDSVGDIDFAAEQ
ncbi:MAG: carboxypeptidase regulatory-like domain-containing protein [Pyrinomonadaceae bacterium]|nr:carboxypeptidase regulatory-like domain-containing protein [Pyrinomonadaceae bacterium]